MAVGRHGMGEVRHGETSCAGAERNRAKRTEATGRQTARNDTERSAPESVIRSLDHVIGVRIPASQPINHIASKTYGLYSTRQKTRFEATFPDRELATRNSLDYQRLAWLDVAWLPVPLRTIETRRQCVRCTGVDTATMAAVTGACWRTGSNAPLSST
jgi:hypothetical protein